MEIKSNKNNANKINENSKSNNTNFITISTYYSQATAPKTWWRKSASAQSRPSSN